MKMYEIYNKDTGEVYSNGYSDFTALNNLVSFRKEYGEDVVGIRWTETKK